MATLFVGQQGGGFAGIEGLVRRKKKSGRSLERGSF